MLILTHILGSGYNRVKNFAPFMCHYHQAPSPHFDNCVYALALHIHEQLALDALMN